MLTDRNDICDAMRNDIGLQKLWSNYREKTTYAKGVSYEEIISTTEMIAKMFDQ